MLLLAIDTSGKSGGVTLAEAGEESLRIVESSGIAGGTFSAQLVPVVAAMLGRHGYKAGDLDGFAAASGPGSFTGLRVGLSAIKGLAEVLEKPIAVVSVLEALAGLSPQAGRIAVNTGTIAAALDAGRHEGFLGIFERTDAQPAGPVMISEELLSRAAFLERLRETRPAVLVTSDGSIAAVAAASGVSIEEVARPGSEMVARLGARKLLEGKTVAVEALDANYLRRSDAEIFFKGAQ